MGNNRNMGNILWVSDFWNQASKVHMSDMVNNGMFKIAAINLDVFKVQVICYTVCILYLIIDAQRKIIVLENKYLIITQKCY